eukprot:2663263-Pyramimonas_sp.AAC.1
MPPPPPGGEAAPPSDPDHDPNDGGPGGIVVDGVPAAPDRQIRDPNPLCSMVEEIAKFDPGPCIALLRDIGVDPVELQEWPREPAPLRTSDGNPEPETDLRQQKRGQR